MDFCSSAASLKTQAFEVTKRNSDNNRAAVETSYSQTTLQTAFVNTARNLLANTSFDKDRILRRSGTESNSASTEASRNSSQISIHFSKKAAEDSEEELEEVLDIKVLPVPRDDDPAETA